MVIMVEDKGEKYSKVNHRVVSRLALTLHLVLFEINLLNRPLHHHNVIES
jgi:hypothetical protein